MRFIVSFLAILAFILFSVPASADSPSLVTTPSGVQVYSRYPTTQTVQELERDLGIRHKILSSDPDNAESWSPSRPYLRDPAAKIDRALSFNQAYAAFYRMLTVVSYDDPQSILNWNCLSCRSSSLRNFNLTFLIQDPGTDTLAFTGTINQQVYVVFRGSSNFKNFVLDLEVWKPDTALDGIPGVYTAAGFYKCFAALQQLVYSSILQTLHQYPSWRVNFIGHSLGGAVASIFAVDFAHNMNLAVNSYTFGSPRVGNQAFVETYESSVTDYWRMVNTFDPVPHMPPNIFNFLHISHEIWQYNPLGQYIHCDWNQDEDPDCSKSISTWLLRMAIHDHISYMNMTDDPEVRLHRSTSAPLSLHDQEALKPIEIDWDQELQKMIQDNETTERIALQ